MTIGLPGPAPKWAAGGMLDSSAGPKRAAVAAAVGMSLSAAVYLSYFFGLFVRPLSAAFGWDRGEISLAVTLCNLCVMVASPWLGRAVDRFGSRRIVLPSLAASALLISLGALNVGNVWFFYVGHLVLGLAAVGTLPLAFTRVILGWFEKNRGLALGVALAGIGIGGAIYPILLQTVISSFGWRAGYVAISAAIFAFALPITFVWLRDPPPTITDDSSVGHIASAALFSRSPPFWLLVFALTMLGLTTTGFSVHLAPLLGDRGFDGAHAAGGVSLLGLSLVAGRIASGFLLDRLPPGLVAFTVIAGSAGGLLIVASGPPTALLICGIVLVGLGIGAEFDFLSYFIARIFGLARYGAIYGWVYAGFMLGCAVGPAAMGYFFDRSGSYAAPLGGLSAGAALAALAFLALGRWMAPPRNLDGSADGSRTGRPPAGFSQ